MEKRKEVRATSTAVEVREADEKVAIQGYASVFNQAVDIWGMFDETIDTRAFDRALSEKQDTRALANHNSSLLLGRVSNGTVELKTDEHGLHDTIYPNMQTSVGRDWVEFIKRGDIKGQSFQFTVAADKWTFAKGQKDKRHILEIGDLLDVGPVTFPAYEGTTIAMREQARDIQKVVRSLFAECSEAFGTNEVTELRCFAHDFRYAHPIQDGERGRYLAKAEEGRSIIVIQTDELDGVPLVRGLKNTPVSVLRQKLDLRDRE